MLGVSERYVKRIISDAEVLTEVRGQFNKELSKNETNSYKANLDGNKTKKKTTLEEVLEETVAKEVVIQNNVSLSQIDTEKMQYFEEVEKQQAVTFGNVKAKENKEEVSSFVDNGVSAFDELMNELEEDEEENPIDLFKAKERKNKMLESQMRKVTDLKVKGNVELLKSIQDKSVPMTFEAYKIIRESDDYRIRRYGKEKIKAISKSKFGLKTMIEFENRYNKIKKGGAL
ncbi:hypothetical protein [Enterococcus casseliflavus]|uniref:hypothetical protein n=1 Tax=Enterococcus casseliflavus TaxID=37734 RepID=UPI0034D2ABEF